MVSTDDVFENLSDLEQDIDAAAMKTDGFLIDLDKEAPVSLSDEQKDDLLDKAKRLVMNIDNDKIELGATFYQIYRLPA